MSFRNPAITMLTLLLAAAVMPSVSTAQEQEQEPVYIHVACMKSTAADYADVETEIWQPMHQHMVDGDQIYAWTFYWVLFGDRSECDYYTANTYRGAKQLTAIPDYADVFAAVHPDKSWDEAMAKTASSRTMVRSELWVWVDGIGPTAYQYAAVNQMSAENRSDYLEYEQEVWKPIHQSLVDGGHTAGWGLYELLSPHGSSIPYNFATVDYLNKLGPTPMEETMRSTHPDREIAAITHEGDDARDHVLGETWSLIARTHRGE